MICFLSIASDRACLTRSLVMGSSFTAGRKVPQNWNMACIVPGTAMTSSPPRDAPSMVSGLIEAIAASPVRTMATRVGFLRDLQDVQVLEVRPTAPVRIIDGLELKPVAGYAAYEFPWATADRLLAELLLADRLDVFLRHDGAFVATARLRAAGRPICGLWVLTRTVRSSTTSMLLKERRIEAAAAASELGAICRSRLNFTS